MPTIYLSPSIQPYNKYLTEGDEQYWMNRIADDMVPMLEQNGIIQTVPGKGSFLAGGDEAKRRQKARGVAALRAALQAALDSGLTGGEIRQECESYLEEKEGKRL